MLWLNKQHVCDVAFFQLLCLSRASVCEIGYPLDHSWIPNVTRMKSVWIQDRSPFSFTLFFYPHTFLELISVSNMALIKTGKHVNYISNS
jgi:hypothetical protein